MLARPKLRSATRRRVLRWPAMLLAPVAMVAAPLPRAAPQPAAYPQTAAALAVAFQRETDAHRRYAAFAGKATEEGYKGIAYMFSAFATSEAVHAGNFRGLLQRLGVQPALAGTSIEPGDTKRNLIAAVEDEIDSIDRLYPDTLQRLRPEGHAVAIRLVQFAWESERQHRDLIRRIARYSPLLFERVAREIDRKTGLYFVCRACGSTLNRVPRPACPICASDSERYRQVPAPE